MLQRQLIRCSHAASSSLPTGTRAQWSVLPGRGNAAGTAGQRRQGAKGAGYPDREGWGHKQGGGERRPGRPGIRGEGPAGQARQGRCKGGRQRCYQGGRAPASVSTRLAAGKEGGQSPRPSWSCWQPARAAASRAVCAAGRPHIPRHTWAAQAAEPFSARGLPATPTASASRGDTCTAQAGAGGSSASAGSQAKAAAGRGRGAWAGQKNKDTKTDGSRQRRVVWSAMQGGAP